MDIIGIGMGIGLGIGMGLDIGLGIGRGMDIAKRKPKNYQKEQKWSKNGVKIFS